MPTRLESKTAKGVALWIDQDAQVQPMLGCGVRGGRIGVHHQSKE